MKQKILAFAVALTLATNLFAQPSGMALIPAGSFTMGNCMDPNEGSYNELPMHTVYVSAFYMDQYDVTLALWQQVYNWAITHGYSFDNAGLGKAANHPVQTIDWYDAVKWCNARSEMEGRIPAYYTSATQTTVYRSGRVDVDNSSVKWNAGYRLPSDAEWEKAARGGAGGQRFPWGNTISESQANYYSCTGCYTYDLSNTGYNPTFNDGVYPYTSPVGYFAPNGYGLYGMAGNVWQWCWDWYDGSWYSNVGATQTDTHGPSGALSYRVLRGGVYNNQAKLTRCANRDGNNVPSVANSSTGFRCVSLGDIGPAPTPPTVVQTNRTPTSAELGTQTSGSFKVFTNGNFVSGVALDPSKKTIVLTHGWNSDPSAWAKYMAELLQFKLGASALNIVAWDWNVEATSPWNNPGKAAANTQGQGRALGMNLLAALGSNYSKPIHFIGHSFGTLVNAMAADYLHTNGFAWQNTHMTLFDEAEVGSHFDSAANQFRAVTTLLKDDSSPKPFWDQPLPGHFAWADNYVSLVGLLHHNAANVILTNFFPNPNFNLLQIGQFIDDLKIFHGYPCLWYDDTVITPSGSSMGWRWSFEENSLNPPPAANTVFIQSFSSSDLDVVPTNFNSASQLLDARLKKALPSLVYSLVDHAPAVVPVVNQVLITIEDAIPQDPYTLTTGPAEAWGMIINLRTGPGTGGSFSPQTKARPLIPAPNDLSGGTNSPVYVWLPLAVPSNAVAMSFDFILQGEGADDLFAVALNGTNVFSLEMSLIQTNVILNSGQIDVSEYAGTNVVLFLGIVGGTSTNANVAVSGIRFYSILPPSLQAQASGNNFVLTWPLSALDYVLETSTNFTSWTTNTDVPVIVDLQNTVTNSISDGARFYRLKK